MEKEIKDLYIKDQVNKINLAIYGPPILNDSPFLLDEVNEYNKEEFEKNMVMEIIKIKDYLRMEKWIIVHNHIQEKKLQQ